MPGTWDPDSRAPEMRLAHAVSRLAQALNPDRIYLFGSRARGDATEDSDWDLMVVVPTSDEPGHRRAHYAYGLLDDVHLPMDVLVWTRSEFDRQAAVVASLPATILREGRLLYAA
ncbi:MAG: nucleotidyltransferase domain-containing protein [Dehalococcoidia bacterium]